MRKISFFIPGDPQGKGRAKSGIVKYRSGAVKKVHYTPEKTRSYEALIRSTATAHMIQTGKKPILGPVRINICACIKIPSSWPDWKKDAAVKELIMPTVKPDYDNIEKTQDALNGICWRDDSYICDSSTSKRYAAIPDQVGVWITIYEMRRAPANITKKSQLEEFIASPHKCTYPKCNCPFDSAQCSRGLGCE